jgi:hypothetical protein
MPGISHQNHALGAARIKTLSCRVSSEDVTAHAVLLQRSARQSNEIKKQGKVDGKGETGCVCHLEEVAPDGWSVKARLHARGRSRRWRATACGMPATASSPVPSQPSVAQPVERRRRASSVTRRCSYFRQEDEDV